MAFSLRLGPCAALLAGLLTPGAGSLLVASAKADPAPAAAPAEAPQTDEDEEPTQAPLTVGTMAIASDAAVSVEAMAIDIALDRVTYAYRFRNKGATALNLAASIALPDIEVSSERSTIYALPSQTAENPVNLTVQSAGKTIPTTAYVQALALGIDRLGELKADNLPLIPFGPAIEGALAGAKPDTLARLESLGLVTPRDPAEPNSPVIADWSLHVVHGWTQTLAANTTTDVLVAFAPIKALYTVDQGSLSGFDALKDQVCLTPQTMAAIKGLLAGKDATADIADLTLANEGPARWLDNPAASVAVRKPSLDSIVTFCGMDPATQGQAVVKGKLESNAQSNGLRVLIISRTQVKSEPGKNTQGK